MPIRSDHGRNAALRSLSTWPLHSPRRLFGSLAVLAALGVSVTVAINATDHTTARRSLAPAITGQTSTVARSVASTIQPSVAGDIGRTSTPSTPAATIRPPGMTGDPTVVSRRFAEAWVNKQDPQSWRARLAPLCTDEYRTAVLPTVAPDSISAATVTGTPALVQGNGRSAEVTIALDSMVLALKLQDTSGTGDWHVADVRPAR
jgi:hypothetical protein